MADEAAGMYEKPVMREMGKLGDENLYKRLGLPSSATQEEIKARYRKVAAVVHPDKQIPENKERAGKWMGNLSEAYGVLSDPQKRAEYDRSLMSGTGTRRMSATGEGRWSMATRDWGVGGVYDRSKDEAAQEAKKQRVGKIGKEYGQRLADWEYGEELQFRKGQIFKLLVEMEMQVQQDSSAWKEAAEVSVHQFMDGFRVGDKQAENEEQWKRLKPALMKHYSKWGTALDAGEQVEWVERDLVEMAAAHRYAEKYDWSEWPPLASGLGKDELSYDLRMAYNDAFKKAWDKKRTEENAKVREKERLASEVRKADAARRKGEAKGLEKARLALEAAEEAKRVEKIRELGRRNGGELSKLVNTPEGLNLIKMLEDELRQAMRSGRLFGMTKAEQDDALSRMYGMCMSGQPNFTGGGAETYGDLVLKAWRKNYKGPLDRRNQAERDYVDYLNGRMRAIAVARQYQKNGQVPATYLFPVEQRPELVSNEDYKTFRKAFVNGWGEVENKKL